MATHHIHQEIDLPAPPARVYEALMDSTKHSKFTGGPAEISPDVGGEFKCHDGVICGRNIELVEGKRIVQAWRVGNWDEGVYSMLKIELRADGDNTKLVLDHSAFPQGQGEHLAGGWHARYWEPLTKFLAD